ncbi:uncharacterized protein LY89DRAFT_184506 [Mollisia scopiformis]|uniref:Uncharacterized protein n=1 Tax=Mollisia scopiformis TaxID=149040 RepID=A0A194XT81_MOLSC|nr:uncharacterized protein LY89DRAFT_184506 [Mollisia scopiformis]KUJ23520.1 hypothetical protein LY89DRAFT_184506 [Mollisia scopiformis]
MSSDLKVYVGFWVNYSKGAILGSTLTLPERNGVILIAAVAIFIQLIGLQSWGIIRFITHQFRTTTQARDGLFHQQQAILRNDTSDIGTVWWFTRMAYAWRSRTQKISRRSIGVILIAILHLVAFGAASVLASHITTTDDQVLGVRSPYCGAWALDTSDPFDSSTYIPYATYMETTMQTSDKYVQDCLVQGQSLPECKTFKQLGFNWTSSTNQPCPFDDMCLGSGDNSLHLDTGLLDSSRDFGINGKAEDRIQWRKTATCVPITTSGYSKHGASTMTYDRFNDKGTSNFTYTAVFYGPNADFNLSSMGITDPNLINSIYILTNYQDVEIVLTSSMYDLVNFVAEPPEDEVEVDFYAMPALVVPDTTLTLAFASLKGGYTEPSNDLWLPAHVEYNLTYSGSTGQINKTIYLLDNSVSVLGCIEQHQFCNPSPVSSKNATCTQMRSITHTFSDEEFDVFDNSRQIYIANLLSDQAANSQFTIAMFNAPLLAESFASVGFSLPIAADQWILEVKNWWTVSLAGTQRLLTEIAIGPASSQYNQFIPPNQASNDTDLAFFCDHQIIRRDDYTNFYTLSISLIFALGVVLFLVNQCLETVVGWYRSKFKTGRWRQRAWWAEGTLQLQRRAFEGIGIKGWERDEWDRVPVTEERKMFSALRNWDEMLPVAADHKGTSIVHLEKVQSPTSSEESKLRNVIVQVHSTTSSTSGGLSAGSDGRPRSV